MTSEGKKYISLREAAEVSGYSQDYLGQLIRKGKLPGKKVYVNVAWMTTEEDVLQYIKQVQNGNGSTKTTKNGNGNGNRNGDRQPLYTRIFSKPVLYFLAGFLGASVFALFYIFAVNVDSRLEDRAIEQSGAMETEMPQHEPVTSDQEAEGQGAAISAGLTAL